MNRAVKNHLYEFGGFELDVARRRLLSADGEAVELSSRVFDTLVCLVEHRGGLVDKSTLMRTVWPDTVVEENNLNQAITTLRKTLGDTPRERRFIATDPGRGYRFVANVTLRDAEQHVEEAPSGPVKRRNGAKLGYVIGGVLAVFVVFAVVDRLLSGDRASRVGSLGAQKSIAVLPFADMSPDGDQEYFSDGIAEELLNQLTRLRGLHVAGRTSSFSFKDKNDDLRTIGAKLNVEHILEGSVRKAGDRVRITVQLVKVNDGLNLWSQTYDRNLDDIFAVQEETAAAVANALSITLGVGDIDFGAGGTRNFEAYDALLRAQALLLQQGPDSNVQAIELLEHAVELDPNYADAWSYLASAYGIARVLWMPDKAREFGEKYQKAVNRAVAIAPDAVSTLNVVAAREMFDGKWQEAEAHHKKALSISPADIGTNMAYANFLLLVGRPQESIKYSQHAIDADPLSLGPVFNLAMAYRVAGNFDEAIRELEHGKSLVGSRLFLHAVLAVTAMESGNHQLLRDTLDVVREFDPGTPGKPSFTEILQGLIDSPEAARQELRRMYADPAYANQVVHDRIAIYAAFFGDHELAYEILLGPTSRSPGARLAIWWPLYKEMRRLPGFKAHVRNWGLVDYWRETGNWGEYCRPLGENDFECA